MNPELERYHNMSSSGFEDVLSKLVSKIGYRIVSAQLRGRYELDITAKKEDPLGEISTLIEVKRNKRDIGLTTVKKLHENTVSQNMANGILITTSGFSESARKYALEKQIRLIDGEEFLNLLKKYGFVGGEPVDKTQKIYEAAFTSSVTEQEAREYFLQKKSKKLFGLVDSPETIGAIEGRYAPVACFELTRLENILDNKSRIVRSRVASNLFYVNLNNYNLYFVHKGVFGNNPSIDSSDILKKIMGLPDNAIRILSEIVKYSEVSYDKLNKEYMLFRQENMDNMVLLQAKDLIDVRPEGEFGYVADVNIPGFDSIKYNLREFLEVSKSIDSKYESDNVVYSIDDILTLLKKFFGGEGSFKEVIYLPYYRCKYVNRKDGTFRLKTLITPKFLLNPHAQN